MQLGINITKESSSCICMLYITGFSHATTKSPHSMFRVNEWGAALRSRVRSLHRLLLCQNETVKPELNGDQNLSFFGWPLPQNWYVFVPFLQFHTTKNLQPRIRNNIDNSAMSKVNNEGSFDFSYIYAAGKKLTLRSPSDLVSNQNTEENVYCKCTFIYATYKETEAMHAVSN